MLIYDIEIAKAIPPRNGQPLIEGIEYCAGWDDHENMGIACVGVYDYRTDRYRLFQEDNLDSFAVMLHDDSEPFIGFNNIAFDNAVFRANGIVIEPGSSYDLLVEIWAALGLGPTYEYPSHAGYGLDAVAKANGLIGKTGYGGTAPVLWQQGRRGAVIDYCLNDVALTKKLVDMVRAGVALQDPKITDGIILVNNDRLR